MGSPIRGNEGIDAEAREALRATFWGKYGKSVDKILKIVKISVQKRINPQGLIENDKCEESTEGKRYPHEKI